MTVLITFFAIPGNAGRGIVPVFRTTPDPESVSGDKAMVYDVRTAKVGDLGLPALLVAFAVVTAGAHALNAWQERTAASSTATGSNPTRWVEYAISAPIMVVIIACLSGVRLVSELTLMAVATAVTMYFGHLVERQGAGGALFSGHTAAGWALFVPVWTVIGFTFLSHLSAAEDAGAEPPAWLWTILVAEVVLFSSFGIFQLFRRRLSSVAMEKGYVGLSFASKATLILLMLWGLASG